MKVECQQRENEVGDGREEERGCNISITKSSRRPEESRWRQMDDCVTNGLTGLNERRLHTADSGPHVMKRPSDSAPFNAHFK